jgi:hypothetical protein
MTVLFHDAMMLDPSNIHALGVALNMMWICPLFGITPGGTGAVAGKLMRPSDPAPLSATSS